MTVSRNKLSVGRLFALPLFLFLVFLSISHVYADVSGYIPIALAPEDGDAVLSMQPEFRWSLPDGCPTQEISGYEVRVRCDEAEWWIFTNETAWGTAPEHWEDDSSGSSPALFRVSTNDGNASLEIKTRGNTWDRVKVRTTNTSHTIGFYEWKVYVPPMIETGACSSIGAFLYSPQSGDDLNAREIDFEIGYGTSADRATHGIADGQLMCHMTVQRDDSSGTSWSSEVRAIDPDDWYYLRIGVFQLDSGAYQMIWWIRREGETSFTEARPAYTCNYGPTDTTFAVECSVENFANLWIGDRQPTQDHYARFEYVRIYDALLYETGFIPATNVYRHTYQPGEWTDVDPVTALWCNSEPLYLGKPHHWHVRCRGSSGEWTAWSGDSIPTQQDFTPYPSIHQWSSRSPITFPHVTSDQTNFTVLLRLHPSLCEGFAYSNFHSADGLDLLVTDASTNPLPFEIESWDTNGTSFVWVQVPLLTSNTLLYAYWGNANATHPRPEGDATRPWDEYCSAVWHLSETGFPYRDSTPSQNHATAGYAPIHTTNGITGSGQVFDGYNTHLLVEDLALSNDTTLSAWVFMETNRSESIQTILANKGSQSAPGLAFFVNQYATDYTATHDILLELGNGSTFTHGRSDADQVTYGGWHHVAVRIDRDAGTARFFIDGQDHTVDPSISTDFALGGPLCLGAFTNQLFPFMGQLDEVRVDCTRRSAEWLQTVYNNQSAPDSFASFGPAEPAYSFMLQCSQPVSDQTVVTWNSRWEERYDIEYSTNLLAGFSSLVTNIPATPPVNCYTTSPAVSPAYLRIFRNP